MENKRVSQVAGSAGWSPGDVRLAPLVLASSSPRRAEILRAVEWPFEMLAANIDELIAPREGAAEYVQRLARAKAAAVAASRQTGLVLGADTVVVVDESILGKPRDAGEARRMLRLLSARRHDVLTGVALVRIEDERTIFAYERTRVRFAAMSDGEIDWYVATGEPMDKAGAYAIQGRAALFIEAIEGDYWNVVGLPLRLVFKLASELHSR